MCDFLYLQVFHKTEQANAQNTWVDKVCRLWGQVNPHSGARIARSQMDMGLEWSNVSYMEFGVRS